MNQNRIDAARGRRRRHVLFLIGIVAAAVYAPVMNADFSCDDICFIAFADYARPIDYLYRFFPFEGEMMYRPLFVMLWTFYYRLGGGAALLHIQLVVAHLLNAWLLFLILSRLGCSDPVSLVTALLFVSTPLSVETIAWINGIDDVYCMMLFLLSLLLFVKIDDRPAPRRGTLLLSLLFGLMALLTRESAITLPIAVLLCDLIVIRARKGRPLLAYLRERWKLCGGYFLLVCSFFGYRTWMLGGLRGYGAGGMTYVPPLMEIAENAFLKLPGLLVFPLKQSTVQNLLPASAADWLARPYVPAVAFLALCALLIAPRRVRWRFVLFGLGWCFTAILAHWQVLHSIGLIAGDLEFSHYLYQPTAGFSLALSALFICGQTGWRRAAATGILAAMIVSYSLISFSYCRVFRHSFRVSQAILRQFKGMGLPLPQGSRVFLMDVPARIEGAPVWWGGTSISVWADPGPSVKPVFEKGLWHYTVEPLVRKRYPYRIFMLNRDVEVEERRNEYEAAPHFTRDYLRSLKPGETDHFLQWLPGEERLVDISGRVRARMVKPPRPVSWGQKEMVRGGPWAPFGDTRWGRGSGRGTARLSIGSGGGGLSYGGAAISPAEYGGLEMDLLLLKPERVEAGLAYRTEEEDRYDDNKRVEFSIDAAPGFAAVRIPLTRRIYDLIDGKITGVRIVFPAGHPAEIEIRSISLR